MLKAASAASELQQIDDPFLRPVPGQTTTPSGYQAKSLPQGQAG